MQKQVFIRGSFFFFKFNLALLKFVQKKYYF
jgi:hypothetical protein